MRKLEGKLATFIKVVQNITNGFVLTLSYFIGIGLTSIVLKLFRVEFWDRNTDSDTWSKPTGGRNLKKMY